MPHVTAMISYSSTAGVTYLYLVDGIPLLDPDLFWSGADLRGDELLEVADGVVFVALHSHLCVCACVCFFVDSCVLVCVIFPSSSPAKV